MASLFPHRAMTFSTSNAANGNDTAETQSKVESNDPSNEKEAQVDPAIAALTKELEQCRKDGAEMKDRALRALAEMENLRVRTAREVTNANKYVDRHVS